MGELKIAIETFFQLLLLGVILLVRMRMIRKKITDISKQIAANEKRMREIKNEMEEMERIYDIRK